MTCASEERREVAAKLRQMADEHDALHAFSSADMRKLAELIDPTCILKDATWDDGTCKWGCICSACGAKLEYEYAQDLAYCPDCGARNEGARVWNA